MLDVKKMIAKMLKQEPVKMRVVQGSINRAFGSYVNVTAPNITGYKFLAWALVATRGWVGSVYPHNAENQTCTFWNASTGQSGTGEIWCTALYIPKGQ